MVEILEAPPVKKKRRARKPKAPILVQRRPPVPILALDQSYTDTGACIIGDDPHKYTGQALFWTDFTFMKYHEKWLKRAVLGEQLTHMYQDWKPKSVVIEGVDFWRDGESRARTALVLITLASFIVDTMKALDEHIEIYMIPTRDWKNALLRTPAERTGKKGTIDLMTALVGAPIHNDNVADSLAIGFCSYQHFHLLKPANI